MPPKPSPSPAPLLIASLLIVAACVWLLERAHDETLLSLETERRRRRELEEQLEKREEHLDGALAKIHELDPTAERPAE